jgi:hypothetical protein
VLGFDSPGYNYQIMPFEERYKILLSHVCVDHPFLVSHFTCLFFKCMKKKKEEEERKVERGKMKRKNEAERKRRGNMRKEEEERGKMHKYP